MRAYLVLALVIVGCGNTSASSSAFVPTDPPGGTAPAWTSPASTAGVCTPGGFIEALASTSSGPDFDQQPVWYSCPGSTCESVSQDVVQCAPAEAGADAGGGASGDAAAASTDGAPASDASADAGATGDTGAPGDASAPVEAGAADSGAD